MIGGKGEAAAQPDEDGKFMCRDRGWCNSGLRLNMTHHSVCSFYSSTCLEVTLLALVINYLNYLENEPSARDSVEG